jgi:penicillin-binding protein 1A
LDQSGDCVAAPLGQERRPNAWKSRWAPALRFAAGMVLVAVLVRSVLLLLMGLAAQSDQWQLPKGELLARILSSCQFEHSRGMNGDNEVMICPTRLPAHVFPGVLRDAVVASEDERFFSHGAIDFRSSVRAAWRSLWGDRQGGSTITQQLARSLLLRKEDSFERKLLEAVLAIRIFSLLSRDEILTRYLNAVPHARNMSGFDDPARHYFGVGAEDLTLAEAALLAGMLPEPNHRDPARHPAEALNGAIGVLQRMLEQGKIGPEQAAEAERELRRRVPTGNLRRGEKTHTRLEYRPYRDLAVREAKANGIALEGDYRLIVFIDPGLQRHLLGELCAITGKHQAAGFFMRPSGEVLATAGSCRYAGAWNRAADIERSIGSTGKLFPLIGLHEAGGGLDLRISTRAVRRPSWPAEPNSRCLARARVTLGFALTHSCNRPWTATAIRLGPRLTEIVSRFELGAPKSAALVPLGGINTSPMRLTRAYGSLRNGGQLPQVRFLLAAIGPKGKIVGLPARKIKRRAMSPKIASTILNALRGPVRHGTARAANSVHALVYGKTGTSSRNMDALFVGLTQDFVGTLWLGHDRPAPMQGVHGGGAPARSFAKLTDFYYLRLAQARFVREKQEVASGDWGRLKSLAPREPGVARQLMVLGATLMSGMLLAMLFRRRKQPDDGQPDATHAPATVDFRPVTFGNVVLPLDPQPSGPYADERG